MEQFDSDYLQELALRSAVAQRCRGAFLHDMRGGLQSIASAFELLNRAANAAPFNQALAGKASEFFRRALDSHERVLDESLAEICGGAAAVESVQLDVITTQSLKFLQNDAAVRHLSLRPAEMQAVAVPGRASNLRLLLLALLTHAVDHTPPDSVIDVSVVRLPRVTLAISSPAWLTTGDGLEFICAVGRRWLSASGGSLVHPGAGRVELHW